MELQLNIDSAITVLEKNLNEHIIELAEANDGWTEKVKTALDKFRDAVDREGLRASHAELYQLLVSRPQDTRAQYSKFLGALRQAKADGQAIVTVDEDDYDQIYNDNWQWRVASKTSNAGYTKGK